ncbi:hypothetical protein H6P81_001711 [Aristolochia fimbriata]|uniref:Uncharacterized protein n=1 Tax=Aristolochia fimbriata TaxID=158543 RepID=A0AAV7FC77_ARIFI|nr:hypothetical protein H6P81_001711 [Aristolochia fimbriata]
MGKLAVVGAVGAGKIQRYWVDEELRIFVHSPRECPAEPVNPDKDREGKASPSDGTSGIWISPYKCLPAIGGRARGGLIGS